MDLAVEEIKIKSLFELTKTLAGDYLSGFIYPWEALSGIGAMIAALGATLSEEEMRNAGKISGLQGML